MNLVKLDLQLHVQSVPIANVSSNYVHGEVYSIQHYVIKFVKDLLRWFSPVSSTNKTGTEVLQRSRLHNRFCEICQSSGWYSPWRPPEIQTPQQILVVYSILLLFYDRSGKNISLHSSLSDFVATSGSTVLVCGTWLDIRQSTGVGSYDTSQDSVSIVCATAIPT
jgi:hypothetical protein